MLHNFCINNLHPVSYAQKIHGLVHGGSHGSFFQKVQNSWSSCWSLRILDSQRFVKSFKLLTILSNFFAPKSSIASGYLLQGVSCQ